MGAEWFFTSVSIAFETRYQNMPVMAVWAEAMEKAHSGGGNKHYNGLHLGGYTSFDSCKGTFYRQNQRLLQNAI